MSRHSSRRKGRFARGVKAFFKLVLLFILAIAFVIGGLFVITKLPADDVQTAPQGIMSSPTPVAVRIGRATEAPTPKPTAAPTEAVTAEPTAAPTAVPTPTPTVEPTATPTPTPQPTPRTAVFRAGGDVMITEGQLGYALKAGNGVDSYDFAPQFALIGEELGDADYTIVNLETTIGMYKDRPYSGYPQFNAPEGVLDVLTGAGVDFVTLANNHMLDRWFDGMKNTVSNVEAAGLEHSGAYVSKEARESAKIVEVQGIKVGFLSYTEGTNGMEMSADAAAREYGVPYLATADFDADVKRLRDAGAEIVVIMPHWGEEYAREPGYSQKNYAKKMAKAGADVILGSHPHVIQNIEWLTVTDDNGDERTVLCAYSLGNFISTQNHHGYTDTGMILEFTVAEQEDGALTIENVGYVPTYCWKHDDTLQVVPALKYANEKPEGMRSDAHSRLKATIGETRAVIDAAFPEIG